MIGCELEKGGAKPKWVIKHNQKRGEVGAIRITHFSPHYSY